MQIKNIVLGIAIIILTAFVTIYGMSIFYPSPQYEDFCKDTEINTMITNQEACISAGGRWTQYDKISQEGNVEGYCDTWYKCGKDYEEANKIRTKKVFYISIPLGILVLVLGGFLFHLEAVGAGLMGGGVVTLIYGAGGYWQYGDDLFRFIISLIGLATVIYIAYWMNNKYGKRR